MSAWALVGRVGVVVAVLGVAVLALPRLIGAVPMGLMVDHHPVHGSLPDDLRQALLRLLVDGDYHALGALLARDVEPATRAARFAASPAHHRPGRSRAGSRITPTTPWRGPCWQRRGPTRRGTPAETDWPTP
jgi:hypothetical protein